MTVDREDILGADGLGDALGRLRAAVRPSREVRGWATVELDRAEVEVPATLARSGRVVATPAEPDDLLGASCRWLRFAGNEVLLLEPSREGPLAASLARLGEGIVAVYLVVHDDAVEATRGAGFGLSTEGRGPLGRERLVLTGQRWGPHLLLAGLDARSDPPAAPHPAADTIGR